MDEKDNHGESAVNTEEGVTEGVKESGESPPVRQGLSQEEGPWLADDDFAMWVAAQPA